MMETVEKYHLQLIALGKQICEELYSVDEKFSLWVGELDRIMKDAAKQLEVFFFQDAFEVLQLSDEEKILAVALFYVQKKTGMPMQTEDAFKILSVNLLQSYRKSLAFCFILNGKYLSLSPVFVSYVEGEIPQLPQGMLFKFPKWENGSINSSLKEQAETIFSFSPESLEQTPMALVIDGPKGCGRHFFIEQILADQQLPALWITISDHYYTVQELKELVECALLYGAFVCVSMEKQDQSIVKWLSGFFTSIAIVTDSERFRIDQSAYHLLTVSLFETKEKKIDAFSMNLLQTNMNFEDLKLPELQHKQLKDICDMIAVRPKVLSDWEFGKKFSYGNGMSILFYGAPGTGKTMAAGVIANELQLPLYRVDLSQLISKYIGETQKNIGKIFDEAEKMECILLFDEADAIFSKRSDVSDAQDRYSNAETAYLLQRIEQYNGVSILATNLLQNFDEAFRRRISYMVHFPLPDEGLRQKLWQDIFPEKSQLGDDFDALALAQAFELSGAAIKNAALHSAYMAMAEDCPIGMKHILRAISNEYAKVGKSLSKSQMELFQAYHA